MILCTHQHHAFLTSILVCSAALVEEFVPREAPPAAAVHYGQHQVASYLLPQTLFRDLRKTYSPTSKRYLNYLLDTSNIDI